MKGASLLVGSEASVGKYSLMEESSLTIENGATVNFWKRLMVFPFEAFRQKRS